MKTTYWIAVLGLLCLPLTSRAQPPPITASPCLWLWSIPYIESNDDDADPGQRELAITDLAEELRDMGIVNSLAAEVGGNRAVVCQLAGRLTEAQRKPIRHLLYSLGGTRLTESIAREMFNAPWYQIYFDDETQDIAFFDGRDGRELQTHPSSAMRLYQLYDAARQWLNRCGTVQPLPRAC